MKTISMTRLGKLYPTRTVLFLSGLIAVSIAATILLAPDAFYAGYGIEVGSNATLASELKAPAGALLVAGLLMFAGVLRPQLATLSLAIAATVYLSYGLGRVLSIAIDGMPHSGMVGAAGIELIVGAICVMMLLRARRASTP